MRAGHQRRSPGVTSHGAAVDAALALVPNPFTLEERRAGGAPLSEAEVLEQEERLLDRLRWVHGLGEATGMASESFSLVALPFIVSFLPLCHNGTTIASSSICTSLIALVLLLNPWHCLCV